MANQTLYVRDGRGTYRRAAPETVLAASRQLALRTLRRGQTCGAASTVAGFLKARLRGLEHEVFACLFLDTRHRLIEYVELFRGTIDGASVHPREVLREAMARNAAAVIFAHNHPSGTSQASEADKQLTNRLVMTLDLVEIRALDHIIVAGDDWLSFAQEGLI